MTTTTAPTTTTPGRPLRQLHLARFGFAIVWALVLAVVPVRSGAPLTVLLVLYPLVDAVSVLAELRTAAGRNRTSAWVNVAVSTAAAIALGIASVAGTVATVLIVWGAWATVSGLTQLLTGLARHDSRHSWPVLASGGLSVVVGLGFLLQGTRGATTLGSIAGYAVLGGIFFLVSALLAGRGRTR